MRSLGSKSTARAWRWAVGLALAVAIAGAALPGPARAEEARVILNVPYRTQLDGSPYAGSNCGPAVIGMVLAGYGREIPTEDLRGQVNDLQRTWGDFDSGTAIENLAVIARRYGLEPLDLFEGRKLRQWSLDDVRRHLDAGRPVVPQVWYRGLTGREGQRYNGDHYIALIGYAGDEFVYHDPVDKDGLGPTVRINAGELERAWRESDLPFAALAIAGSAERAHLRPAPTPTPLPPKATIAPTATLAPTATPPATMTATPPATPPATATPPPIMLAFNAPPPATVEAAEPDPVGILVREPAPAFDPRHLAVTVLIGLMLALHLAVSINPWGR
jgi:hypothetical protein